MRRTKKTKGHKSPRRKRRNHIVQCLNCNKVGHVYRDCRFPLTSYGILLFRYNKALRAVQYLMICRRHTFGYVEFIRGCYDVQNRDYIKQLLMEMTIDERRKIQTMTFKELWVDLWQKRYTSYNHEYITAHNAFKRLMESAMCKDLLANLPNSVWTVPEWGFPKGKRNISESPLQCAMREMQEESGLIYNQGYTEIESNSILPKQVTEIFQSTDKRIYRHIYYIYTHCGSVDYVLNKYNRMQMREVSTIAWLTYDECMSHIRSYNIAKQKMLTELHPLVVDYCGPLLSVPRAINSNYKENNATTAKTPAIHQDGQNPACHQTPACQQALTTDDQCAHPVSRSQAM